MQAEDFRRYGHSLVDWIADYRARLNPPATASLGNPGPQLSPLPVLAQVRPGAIRAALPPEPPLQNESFEAIMADVDNIILPGLTHWQSPNFFAYFPANASAPSVLGELLSAGLGVQGMLWATSPACTELETHVLDWLAAMLALPGAFRSTPAAGAEMSGAENTAAGGGVIEDTASSSLLCALLAARERLTAGDGNRLGPEACRRLTVYASTQAHSSVEKAVRIAGLGSRQLRLIDVDAAFALRPAALRQRLEADLRAGDRPCFAVATLGTTSSNAIDPLAAIGPICREFGVWLHVDAAMSGAAALCPEFRHFFQGLEFADSFCFNPHKWLFTNFDCSCLYLRDRQSLIQALGIFPEYLRNPASDSGEVFDYRDWQIPLGRRFRALKLWFVIRSFGVEGLQRRIRDHVAWAQQFAQWVRGHPDFELAAPAPLNLVCFRHRGGDAFNQALLDRLNASGRLYLTHTRLNGRFTLRFCVGQTDTELRHVENAWRLIRQESHS